MATRKSQVDTIKHMGYKENPDLKCSLCGEGADASWFFDDTTHFAVTYKSRFFNVCWDCASKGIFPKLLADAILGRGLALYGAPKPVSAWADEKLNDFRRVFYRAMMHGLNACYRDARRPKDEEVSESGECPI